jgi:hypothetical protein
VYNPVKFLDVLGFLIAEGATGACVLLVYISYNLHAALDRVRISSPGFAIFSLRIKILFTSFDSILVKGVIIYK